MGRAWTLQELATVDRLHAEGRTYVEIAAQIDRTPAAVGMARSRYGRTRGTMGRPRSRVTEARYRRAYLLRQDGMTWPQVGRRLGIRRRDAVEAARIYAERYELPWPIAVVRL